MLRTKIFAFILAITHLCLGKSISHKAINNHQSNAWEESGYFEGDIILSPHQRNGVINVNQMWLNGEIPYEIDPIFDGNQQAWIETTLKEFLLKTCIIPRRRTAADKDYVHITGTGDGCFSSVGRTGGAQQLNLKLNIPGEGCMRSQAIIHEFVHALGFYHQQSANDRDEYVTIVWDNIIPGRQANFNKSPPNTTTSFGEPYDYSSIMHYSEAAFSKNGEKTIITKDPNAVIGQSEELSKTDIVKINKMYKCKNETTAIF